MPQGTAILVPGQYKNCYGFGKYRGYECLRQVLPVKVYRDDDGDEEFDTNSDTVEEGLFGIHIHKAGVLSKIVGTWSAGCQVFQRKEDFEEFMNLCKDSLQDLFTYTLIEF